MKPLVISSVCIVLLVTTWGLFIQYTSNTLEDMSADLIRSVYQPASEEKWSDAASGMARITEKWHKHKIVFYMLSNHGVVREADISIARAQEFIKNEERSDSLAELSVINELFLSIQQGEAFTVDNLL